MDSILRFACGACFSCSRSGLSKTPAPPFVLLEFARVSLCVLSVLSVNVCSKYFSTDFSGLRLRRETLGQAFIRMFGWKSGRTSGRTVVGGARVVSGTENKAFDRGGPVWPPRSNVTNDRLRWGSGGALPPQPKTGRSGGQCLPSQNRKVFEKK